MGQLAFLVVIGLVAMVGASNVNVDDLDENELEELEVLYTRTGDERVARETESTKPSINIGGALFQSFLLKRCLTDGRNETDFLNCALIPLEEVLSGLDLPVSTLPRRKCISVIKMKYCFNFMLGNCSGRTRFGLTAFRKSAILYFRERKKCIAENAWPGDDFVPTEFRN